MLRCPFPKLQHLGKLVGRVDVQNGKWNLSKKRFAREPDEDIGILPHRPRHGDVFERVIRLAKNENALVLILINSRTRAFSFFARRITRSKTSPCRGRWGRIPMFSFGSPANLFLERFHFQFCISTRPTSFPRCWSFGYGPRSITSSISSSKLILKRVPAGSGMKRT